MVMNDPTGLGDVGFAQFTAALITQTLDAVIAAQLQQEEKLLKLREAAGLPPARFAEEIPPEEVVDEISRLFPPPQYPAGVAPGAPYRPLSPSQSEEPPIQDSTGYIMKKGDFTKQEGGLAITESGYKNIAAQVRLALAAQRQAGLVQMVQRGVPRVVVDHGRVNAKLFFQFASSSQAGSSPQLQRAMLPQLVVRAVELRRPEVARLTVNVVGEVDITFKTISD